MLWLVFTESSTVFSMGEKYSLPVIEGHTKESVLEASVQYVSSFTPRYEAAYMWYLLQKTQLELESKSGQPKWQLNQRKWESYNRPLKQGVLHVLAESLGKKWKKRYCVMQSDYSLEVYSSKEDFDKANKPKLSATFGGYQVICNVDSYWRRKLELEARDYGYVGHDLSSFVKKVTLIGQAGKRPTMHVFCLAHPQRGVIYFAAHTAIDKDQWFGVFNDCIRHSEGVCCDDELAREAFTFAVEQTVRMEEFPISDRLLSGTPEEILADVSTVHQLHDCREVVFPKIKGGLVTRYKTWNYLASLVYAMMKSLVAKHFIAVRRQTEERCLARRQEIISNMPQLNFGYNAVAKAIKDVLADCFDPYVTTEIVPKLPNLVNTMSDSLASPLRATRELFLSLVQGVQEVATSQSSQFANNIDRYFLHTLDFAPRNPDFVCPVKDWHSNRKTALDVLEKTFHGTDFSSHLNSICVCQQRLLDSAVCTFEALCGEVVAKSNGKLSPAAITRVQTRVVKKLDYDIMLAQRRFFRSVIQSGTMELTRESIEESCRPKMLDFKACIPDDLQEFIPVTNVFTDVLAKRFTELINPSLSKCMQQLVPSTIRRFCSSSTISSVSSFASVADDDRGAGVRSSNNRVSPLVAGDAARSGAVQVGEGQRQQQRSPSMDGETGEVYQPPRNVASTSESPNSVPVGGDALEPDEAPAAVSADDGSNGSRDSSPSPPEAEGSGPSTEQSSAVATSSSGACLAHDDVAVNGASGSSETNGSAGSTCANDADADLGAVGGPVEPEAPGAPDTPPRAAPSVVSVDEPDAAASRGTPANFNSANGGPCNGDVANDAPHDDVIDDPPESTCRSEIVADSGESVWVCPNQNGGALRAD